MKYGELKIECLATMDEMNEIVTLDNLSDIESDESYKELFARMPGSINRAMDRIANRKKFPLKSIKLKQEDARIQGYYLVFDLNKIRINELVDAEGYVVDPIYLTDYRSLKRVSYLSMFGYYPTIDYIIEGSTLMIPREYREGELRIVYYPKAPAVSSKTENEEELSIPDELARIIPYYVKSDLMTRDEAELATLARNKFELALDEINLETEDSFGVMIEKTYRI